MWTGTSVLSTFVGRFLTFTITTQLRTDITNLSASLSAQCSHDTTHGAELTRPYTKIYALLAICLRQTQD